METSPYAIVEKTGAPASSRGWEGGDLGAPVVRVPRQYNAAVDFIDRHVAQGRGHRLAFIEDAGSYSRRTTYAQLASLTARTAGAIRGLGVQPEQRVMLCLHDTVDFVAIFFGAIRAGAVAVPVSTLLTTEDYAYLLRDSRARVLFVSDGLLSKIAPALERIAKPPRVVVVKSPVATPPETADSGPPSSVGTTRVSRTVAHLEFEAFIAAAPASGPSTDPEPTTSDDVAFWLYSSGSTGAPKAAVHLQSHPVQTAALYGLGVLGIDETDTVFSAAKLFFAYGLGNAMTFPLHVGATAVLMAERPTPASVMRTLETCAPTIFFGVPTLFAAILADRASARHRGSPNLRVSVSAGEPLPRRTGEKWKARFGTEILDGIGSTELLHIFLSNRPGELRYGTTGKPVPGYELKLLDEDGKATPPEEEGSLWVKGPTSAIAYHGQRAKSLDTFHGPWTRTGDRFVASADGFYTYAGRADDMLKVGGIWVSPIEVESALGEHESVFEAAVVGHPDADGLIKPRAFVVLQERQQGSDALVLELQAFVKAKLALYKYPRTIEFVRELPKTATGKIQRFKLRG